MENTAPSNAEPPEWHRLTGLGQTLAWIMFGLCVLIIVKDSLGPLVAMDSFWHLAMGRDFVEQGLSPYIDHHSFTYEGQPIEKLPVVFQLLLYGFAKGFGVLFGFQLFRITFWLLPLSLLFAYMLKTRTYLPVLLLVLPMAAAFFISRNMVRPEILSYTFSFLCLYVIFRARETFETKHLVLLAFLLILWVNTNSSAVFGFVFAGSFYIGKGIALFFEKATIHRWIFWLTAGVLTFMVGFLNPGLSHPILGTLQFDASWYQLITEYQQVGLEKQMLFFRFFWALLGLLLVFCLFRKDFDLALILLVFGYQAWQISRMISPTAFIFLVILVYVLSRYHIAAFLKNLKLGVLVPIAVVYALANLNVVLFMTRFSFSKPIVSEIDVHRYPVDVVNYLMEKGAEGEIFNQYRIGGFLSERLFPRFKVYIDGRTNVLYPLEHFNRYQNATLNGRIFAEEVDRYGFDYALFMNDDDILENVLGQRGFHVDFMGEGYTLLSRDKPNFPNLGRLWVFPNCSDGLDPVVLEEELALARQVHPEQATAVSFLSALLSSNRQASAGELSEAIDLGKLKRPARIMAYMAFHDGDPQKALDLLGNIQATSAVDILNAANILMGFGDLAVVESFLYLQLSKKKLDISGPYLEYYYELLTTIKKDRGFGYYPDAEYRALGRLTAQYRVESARVDPRPCFSIWDVSEQK